MKYALIVLEGVADDPRLDLDDQTPLAVARTPNLDWISSNGRQGTVVTVPESAAPRAEAAALSLLGYDPATHDVGWGSLEAVAAGIEVGPTDLVFRCNLVTVVDGRMGDFAAGGIGDPEAAELVRLIDQALPDDMRLVHSSSYRSLLTITGGANLEVDCTPPHTIGHEAVAARMPRGRDAGRLKSLMESAEALLADHEINAVRRDLGENPATGIWPWGQGRAVKLPAFREQYGIERGGGVATADVMRGLALAVGFDVVGLPGLSEAREVDYRGKGCAAVAAVDRFDFVFVHVEAPDEAGDFGPPADKVAAIERIDAGLVGPTLDRLRRLDQWKIMVVASYPSGGAGGAAVAAPWPFCLAGAGVPPALTRPFSESAAQTSDLHCDPGHELMEYFLKR